MNPLTAHTEIASFTPYPIHHHPVRIQLGQESLTVVWDHGHQSEYHYLWLRDNCHCAECVSSLTREQVFEICDVPLTIKPLNAYISDDHRIIIEWDYAQHTSQFHPGWLLSHCYSDVALQEKKWLPEIWDKARISDELPSTCCDSIMQNDAQLLTWLRELRDYGLALVTNVDTSPNSLIKVANRISFIRETNFGTIFNVEAKADANSTAYTDLRLPLHTDLPTRELQPGLQFLHCLVNDATGGESILVDGFKIADYMRENHPQEFHSLSTIPMSFYNKDKNSDYRCRGTAIVTDSNAEVVEVRLANFLRGPIDVPSHQTMALYTAYRCFIQLTREAKFQFFHRLNAGDLIVFDNRRVLHARNAFDLKTGMRHLQGCYIDRDELLSRIRVLERNTIIDQ
ncbi:TauD/TfdA family dioxygenase [Neptunomonas antarctica]|uniref:Gamma-butyrobetaine dioxygenase n=1 Tax=Neptunomonas antarctica TaxID=619304 RepID=A0A1N7L5V2_9GAMM|nr:TauD/TfdA family dioxygenase [Neptunomonas antarctica]SIS69218.1 gamma-butyrobetaine dioxygenase [Neptunomonas antarctica]